MRKMTFAAALDDALAVEMRRDESVICLGTQPPASLLKEFGPSRILKTPISEAAFSGAALGAAACGLRPVVFWRNVTFSFVAFDAVINQAAKLRYMFGGQRDFPVVFRTTCGGGFRIAAQHSQSPYAIFAHTVGVKVLLPSNARDGMGLLRSAVRDPNPVVMFEVSRLEPIQEELPDQVEPLPLGVAAVPVEGEDLTIVALGYMVGLAEAVAADLAREGIRVEVVDPRTLVPLDVEAIRRSVRKTGRLVVADESTPMCSMASEILAAVLEDPTTFRALRAPAARVCSRPVPVPYSPALEDFVLPDQARITAAARVVLEG